MRTLVDVKEVLKNFLSNESATCHSNDMWLLNIPEDATMITTKYWIIVQVISITDCIHIYL